MTLLTLGDSFTYGEELQSPSENCWPQQLANMLDLPLVNLGKPSNSNPAICRQLIDYFARKQNPIPSLVVIGWSSPGRTEHSDISGNFNIWPGYSGQLFKQSHPWRDELLRYTNQYHNDSYLFELYFNQLVFVQSFLKSKGIDYVMLDTVGNEYYKNNFASQYGYATHLLDFDKMISWPNEGMIEWADEYPKGPNGHFLEEGHQVVAEKIYQFIKGIK
jgi:hypothetical protein